MENINIEKNTSINKKVFLRKEVEANRLGEELYSEDILSQYSVYVLRKFESAVDYQELDQIESLIAELPEQFNQEFESCVMKKLYLRVTAKAVHLTVLLALARPLSREQMSELRIWFSNLEVRESSLEHVSNFSTEVPLEVIKGLQETNSEVLLLTEMMNQFNGNLTDIYSEIQTIKEKKSPPIVKVVPSQAVTKQALESGNNEKLLAMSKKIEQLAEEFSAFKTYVSAELASMPKPKKPPKFKIVLGPEEQKAPTLDARLEEALSKIEQLNRAVEHSDQQMLALNQTIEKMRQKKPKVSFVKAKKVDKHQANLAEKLAETGQEVTNISTQLKQINQKLLNIETSTIKGEQMDRIEKDHSRLQATTSETNKLTIVIHQITDKLQTIEAELNNKQKMIDQQKNEQAHLLNSAAEIKRLAQTVNTIDSQISQANQKIATLEKKQRQAIMNDEATAKKQPADQAVKPMALPADYSTPQSNKKSAAENSRNFPSKETFLQATKPAPSIEQPEERATVTLAIEEMLERVSEKHPQLAAVDSKESAENSGDSTKLRRLKKLEWDIHALFQVSRGLGHKGMLPKKEFYASVRKIEVLTYLWLSVVEREQRDILLGNELSCQQLIEDLPDFLNKVDEISQKRKVMGKWLYLPKEIEQKIHGYELLSEYFEVYLDR